MSWHIAPLVAAGWFVLLVALHHIRAGDPAEAAATLFGSVLVNTVVGTVIVIVDVVRERRRRQP